MDRAISSGLVGSLLALVLVAPASCAKGNDAPASAEVAPVTPAEGDAGPDAACAPCAADEVCSAGVCVSVDTDADKDGVKAGVDCDDHDPAIHPGAAEICNGKDDNCDGKADEGFDADNDGFYACAHGTIPVDCDDTNGMIHPGAPEICNGKDDDCNGKIDEVPASLTGSLAPVDPHWHLAGSALLGTTGTASAGWAELTTDAPNEAGALWWNAPYTFDVFDMTSTFWIQQKVNGADGMTFAWVVGNNVNQVGLGASTYGIGGLTGYSVVIDTFPNTGEPTNPYLGVLQNADVPVPLIRVSIPDVRNSANHSLEVKLEAGGKISVWVDAVNYINQFTIPGYVAFSGHWGFTGGTGSASEAHWVRDATMKFPNGQGCVP